MARSANEERTTGRQLCDENFLAGRLFADDALYGFGLPSCATAAILALQASKKTLDVEVAQIYPAPWGALSGLADQVRPCRRVVIFGLRPIKVLWRQSTSLQSIDHKAAKRRATNIHEHDDQPTTQHC
jgi:hypothetical protein